MKMLHVLAPASLALCLAGADAAAQTLYKLIDKNGKVTYSEKAPKDFDGKVIRMDIDPKANTATLPPAPAGGFAAARAQGKAADDRVRAARQKLETARQKLDHARNNPAAGEVARVGIKGGGTRPVPTEDYQKRLAGLEESVKLAEEELRTAERDR